MTSPCLSMGLYSVRARDALSDLRLTAKRHTQGGAAPAAAVPRGGQRRAHPGQRRPHGRPRHVRHRCGRHAAGSRAGTPGLPRVSRPLAGITLEP